MTQLYRCRIFRTHPPEVLPPKGVFTQIWDTLDEPDDQDPQPPGDVVLEFVHTDIGLLRNMVSYCIKMQGIVCGFWRKRVPVDEDLIEEVPFFAITRCRLYRLKRRNVADLPRFVEVWDTLDNPYESEHTLPRGELVACTQSRSERVIRSRMNREWSRLGIVAFGTSGCMCGFLRGDYVLAVPVEME